MSTSTSDQPEGTRPQLDLASRQLRLSPRHLDALGAAAHGREPDPSVAQELAAAGILDDGGAVREALAPLAAAAGSPYARISVARLSRERERVVRVTWSPAGVLALRAGPSEVVQDVVFAQPSSLARILWQILQLGPRPLPATDARLTGLSATELLAPFHGPDEGWVARVGLPVAEVVLDRVDLRLPGRDQPAVLSVLDHEQRGLWEIASADGNSFDVAPAAPTTVFSALAGWQATITELIATADR